MSGGRPTKLTGAFKDLARYYLENFQEFGDLIPSVAGLAVVAKVSRSQLHAWRAEQTDPEYSDIYDDLLAQQERTLIAGGLSKKFSSQITALVLGKHGYTTRTDLTSSDGTMTPQVTEITRRIVKPDK